MNKRVWKTWLWWINRPSARTNFIKRFTNPLSYLIKHAGIYTPQDILNSILKHQEISNLASLNLHSIGSTKISITFQEQNRERRTLILDSIFDHTHRKASIFKFSLLNDTFDEESSLLLVDLPGVTAVDFDALCSTKNGYEFPQEQTSKSSYIL